MSVLVAVDGSTGSDRVISSAIAEARARCCDLSVFLIHDAHPPFVAPAPLIPIAGMESTPSHAEAICREVHQLACALASSSGGARVRVHETSVVTSRSVVLREAAREAELIIIGLRSGRGSLGRRLALSLLRPRSFSSCPLLLISQ
jgi:nucleotide-binding universal stress UspA family protein